jgi:hypothetical protein
MAASAKYSIRQTYRYNDIKMRIRLAHYNRQFLVFCLLGICIDHATRVIPRLDVVGYESLET